MRRLHRFAAVLMGVLLLQVSLLAAATACSPTPNGMAAAEVAGGLATDGSAGGDGAHAHHEPRPAGEPDGGSRSRHHDGQMHCPSAMACTAVGVAAVSVALPEGAPLLAGRALALDAIAPASITGAPEPPPPRA